MNDFCTKHGKPKVRIKGKVQPGCVECDRETVRRAFGGERQPANDSFPHGLPPQNCMECSGYPGRLLHPTEGHPCNCHFCSWARLSSWERQLHPYKSPA